MKKILTVDDIMVAFVSALGYGLTYRIPAFLGWPMPVCIAVCLFAGVAIDRFVNNIAFSKAVQKKVINRVLTYTAFLLIFLIGQYVFLRLTGQDIMEDLVGQLIYVIGFPVIGFIVNIFIHGYHARKIRRRYGDGSEGYVFDIKDEDILEMNKVNHPVTGGYDTSLAVKTKTGIYVGEKHKKSIYYLGIPYAKPPVGELRWKAPEPLPSSDGVFEAKNFGASAIQVEHKGSILKHHRQSEDCLTLNIVTGSQEKDSEKPVIVLFHNGDFTYGGSGDPLLYGLNFALSHPDTVFVSFNYRLNILGFIDFSEVPGGEAYPDAKNLGILDQIAALKWINENIAFFGGDPGRITVMGFDSGATSICMLSACEQAKGLFQKAFVFNGNLATVYDSPAGPRALAADLLRETGASNMEDLLQLDENALKTAAQNLWEDMCAPVCDGILFPSDIYSAFKAGAASGIDFIIGFPGDETKIYRSTLGDHKYEELVAAALSDMQNYLPPALKDKVQDHIKEQMTSLNEIEARSGFIEQFIALCIYRLAVKLSEGGNKVHLLYWDEKPLIDNLGSGTVDVAASLLGNSDALHMYGSVMNKDISETLQSLLLKFMNGDELQLYPNEVKGVDAFNWEAFPKSLVVSESTFHCTTIKDDLTEVEGLFDFFMA